jgi:hypothetical protein
VPRKRDRDQGLGGPLKSPHASFRDRATDERTSRRQSTLTNPPSPTHVHYQHRHVRPPIRLRSFPRASSSLSASKGYLLTPSQHASHVRRRPARPEQAHLHAQKGHRRRSQQERPPGPLLARRQVLEASRHHQEALWTASDAAE